MAVSSSLRASSYNVYLDGQGSYIGLSYLGNSLGYGGNFAVKVHDYLNLTFNAMLASGTREGAYSGGETLHKIYMGGIEILPPISILRKYRLFWRTSLLGGYSTSKIKYNLTFIPEFPYSRRNKESSGMALAVKTGILFDFTQHLSLFFDLGFHKSFYQESSSSALSVMLNTTDDKFGANKVHGIMITGGVRVALFRNRDIE